MFYPRLEAAYLVRYSAAPTLPLTPTSTARAVRPAEKPFGVSTVMAKQAAGGTPAPLGLEMRDQPGTRRTQPYLSGASPDWMAVSLLYNSVQ